MTTFTSLIQTPALSYQEIMMPTSCAMMIGFASGATTSGKLAGYQFMVENLHRLPRNTRKLVLLSKTKNYKVILELFTLLPAIERRKSIAGALAGLNMALGASLFYQLRPTISPRRLLLGTLMGLCAGLAEDMKAHLEEEDPPL
ncbi:hypothetical protein PSHT_15003 [Puccinia striiformis]|uniref:Uncharacterized protein n=1 Tax=Puccinia striiformis TaxID=27350 RepID=A0A2S4UHP7_9BASI|nr:hypothetical protein PSHT_15003 [Puccinia striiformis]